MDTSRSEEFFRVMMSQSPRAYSHVYGSDRYPEIAGMVLFFETERGTVVFAEFQNLPVAAGECTQDFFGFHIHEGGSCSGNEADPFANTGEHLNPYHCPHPEHMGDLPVLLSAMDGYAWTVFFTDKFMPRDVAGKTIVVHRMPDDFMTQPSGNSGEKIACGMIF
ncbi:MAG: superoxide dismutase family protein [Clostridiales bacterium]|nr:superoxide dismutase family protein [Clostridiales bacterium]